MDRLVFLPRTALQLRHFAALLSAASPKSSGIVGGKLVPSLYTSVTTWGMQAL